MKRADRFGRLPTGELTLRAHLLLPRYVLSSRLLDDVLASLGARQRPRGVASLQSRLGEAVARARPLLVQMLHAYDLVALGVHVADARRGFEVDHAVASLPVSGIPKELVVVPLEAVGGVGLVRGEGGQELIGRGFAVRERRRGLASPPDAARRVGGWGESRRDVRRGPRRAFRESARDGRRTRVSRRARTSRANADAGT